MFQVPELPYDKKLKRKRGSVDKSKTTKLKEKFIEEKGEGEIICTLQQSDSQSILNLNNIQRSELTQTDDNMEINGVPNSINSLSTNPNALTGVVIMETSKELL